MTEQEYMDLSDLQLLRSMVKIVHMVNAFDNPNAARIASIRANLVLSIDDLEDKIEVSVDDKPEE